MSQPCWFGPIYRKNLLSASMPPRAYGLLKLAESGKFPSPGYLEIYTGENDDGCDPSLATRIGSLIPRSKVTIVKDQGHRLDPEFVKKTLIRFQVVFQKNRIQTSQSQEPI